MSQNPHRRRRRIVNGSFSFFPFSVFRVFFFIFFSFFLFFLHFYKVHCIVVWNSVNGCCFIFFFYLVISIFVSLSFYTSMRTCNVCITLPPVSFISARHFVNLDHRFVLHQFVTCYLVANIFVLKPK